MKWWQWVGVVVLSAQATLSVATGVRHALHPEQSQDFTAVYMASRLWLHGLDPYAAYSGEEWRERTEAAVAPEIYIVRPYSTLYPPVALQNLSLISAFEWETARRLWLAFNLLLACYVPWVVRRLWFSHWSRVESLFFFLFWFGGFGLRVGFNNGQHALFWFACLLTALWAMASGRMGWAGIPLALSLHKYSLTGFFVPYFGAQRYVRTLAVTAVVSAGLLGLFFLRIDASPADVVRSYLMEVQWWYARSEGGDLPGHGVTHFYPVLAALFGPGQFGRTMMMVLFVAGLVATSWPRRRRGPGIDGVDIACVLLLTLWGSYHAIYDTIVLILPLGLIVERWRHLPFRLTWWSALAALTIPVWYFDPARVYRAFFPGAGEDGGIAFFLTDGYPRVVIAAALVTFLIVRWRDMRASGVADPAAV